MIDVWTTPAGRARPWVTCPWYGCRRRIARLRKRPAAWHVTPDGREPVPFPDDIAEIVPGAGVTFDHGVTVTCPRGHATTYGPQH